MRAFRRVLCAIVVILLRPFREVFTHINISPAVGEVPQILNHVSTYSRSTEGSLSCQSLP